MLLDKELAAKYKLKTNKQTKLAAKKLVFAGSQPGVPDLTLILGCVMFFIEMRRSCSLKTFLRYHVKMIVFERVS